MRVCECGREGVCEKVSVWGRGGAGKWGGRESFLSERECVGE